MKGTDISDNYLFLFQCIHICLSCFSQPAMLYFLVNAEVSLLPEGKNYCVSVVLQDLHRI